MEEHDMEYTTSFLTPPGVEDICGSPGCGKSLENGGSWIEWCGVHETYSIVPLCVIHHDFAAEALAGIHEVVAFGGLLQ